MIEYVVAAAKEKLIRYGAGLLLTTAVLAALFICIGGFIQAIFSHDSKPDIQLVAPPAPACKVCHCHQSACHRECGEENMCNLKCEGLCEKKKQ